jgi:hypothetical protein
MDTHPTYDNIDALRSHALAGAVAVARLRGIADIGYVVDNFGIDFVKKFITDIIADYDYDASTALKKV